MCMKCAFKQRIAAELVLVQAKFDSFKVQGVFSKPALQLNLTSM